MHKKIIPLFLTFLLVGCNRIDKTNKYIDLVNHCLKEKAMTNNVSLGYKYYMPKGVIKLQDYDYNQVFLIDKTTIYLYVDIVSYYNKKEEKSTKSNNAIYYEAIDNNGKKGYIEITKDKSQYYLKISYHYSKIEAYLNENELNKTITIASIILNSIQYNDKAIEKVLKGDFGEFSEVTYEVNKPEDASNNFSQYLEEYVQKEKKEQKPDE